MIQFEKLSVLTRVVNGVAQFASGPLFSVPSHCVAVRCRPEAVPKFSGSLPVGSYCVGTRRLSARIGGTRLRFLDDGWTRFPKTFKGGSLELIQSDYLDKLFSLGTNTYDFAQFYSFDLAEDNVDAMTSEKTERTFGRQCNSFVMAAGVTYLLSSLYFSERRKIVVNNPGANSAQLWVGPPYNPQSNVSPTPFAAADGILLAVGASIELDAPGPWVSLWGISASGTTLAVYES